MLTSIKIRIDLPVDADKSWDPVTDFKKHIEKIPGIKYEMLPYEEDHTNCVEKLFESGLTNVINPEQYSEALGTPYDTRTDIIHTIGKYLKRIILSDHLVIVDNYIFWGENKKESYTNFILDIFRDYIPKLQKITFVTNKRHYDKELHNTISEGFLNVKKHISIDTKFSDNFHDRLWVCGDRGIFVGTSLNGIGQKYSLIDYIKREDLSAIHSALRTEKLI